MTPTLTEAARKCAESVTRFAYSHLCTGLSDDTVEFLKHSNAIAALITEALTAALKEQASQWRMSSVCRELQAEVEKLKGELAKRSRPIRAGSPLTPKEEGGVF